MATVTIDIPDELKARYENLFDKTTITEMLTRMLNDALEQESLKRRLLAADRLLARRKVTPAASANEINEARMAGRP